MAQRDDCRRDVFARFFPGQFRSAGRVALTSRATTTYTRISCSYVENEFDSDGSAADRDLYSGLIRLHVLHHAAEEPIFGLGMIEELARHGYRISPGSLYPLLHGLGAERAIYVRGRSGMGQVAA